MAPNLVENKPAGASPTPAGSIAGSASAPVSPAGAASVGQGLAERVRAAAAYVVKKEREKPGTYPEQLVEMAVSILLTPVPQLRRELAEQGRLSILDLLFEVSVG